MSKHSVELTVNGVPYPVTISTDRTLSTVLRNELGLTGTKEGCDDCECGCLLYTSDAADE